MREIIGFFLLAALLAFAFKIAIVLLVVAGLIFRTEQTIGLIAILAIFAGFSAHPVIGIGLAVLLLGVSLYFKRKERRTGGTKP